jgi:hypothetical protein
MDLSNLGATSDASSIVSHAPFSDAKAESVSMSENGET